jgi:hypothetical protein
MPPPIQDAPKRRNPSTAAGEVRARAARANRLLIPLRAHGWRPRSQSRAGQPEGGGSQADIASWSIKPLGAPRCRSRSWSPRWLYPCSPRAAHQAPARAAPLPGPSSHHPRPPLRNRMAACTEDAIHSRAPLFRAGVEGRLEAAGRLGGARRALEVGREGKMPSPLCSVIYLEVLRTARRDVMGLLVAGLSCAVGPPSRLFLSIIQSSGVASDATTMCISTHVLLALAIKVLPQIAFLPCAVRVVGFAAVDRKQMLTGDQLHYACICQALPGRAAPSRHRPTQTGSGLVHHFTSPSQHDSHASLSCDGPARGRRESSRSGGIRGTNDFVSGDEIIACKILPSVRAQRRPAYFGRAVIEPHRFSQVFTTRRCSPLTSYSMLAAGLCLTQQYCRGRTM